MVHPSTECRRDQTGLSSEGLLFERSLILVSTMPMKRYQTSVMLLCTCPAAYIEARGKQLCQTAGRMRGVVGKAVFPVRLLLLDFDVAVEVASRDAERLHAIC